MSALLHGGCLCGAVRFEARDVHSQCFCYCTSCRRAAGAPVVPWGTVERSAFTITRGVLHEVRSSPPVLRGFCEACGTSISYRHAGKPEELDVALAIFDDLAALQPQCHLWVEDKPSWLVIGDGLPQYPRDRRSGTAP